MFTSTEMIEAVKEHFHGNKETELDEYRQGFFTGALWAAQKITGAKLCENCPEWELLKHDKDPWLIHCPTCGRALE